MATYTKKHKSDKAVRSHLEKIRKRGGKATVEGNTINYKFDNGGKIQNGETEETIKLRRKIDLLLHKAELERLDSVNYKKYKTQANKLLDKIKEIKKSLK